MVHKFRRSFDGILTLIFGVLVNCLLWAALSTFDEDGGTFSVCITAIAVLIVVYVIAQIFILPDFYYIIRPYRKHIVIEILTGDNDCRKLNRDFDIVKQTRKYIILEDGDATIKIAYNRELLKFLEGIRYS